jgi:hypothetical protein
LAYPDFNIVFEIDTDASRKQLGEKITQDNTRSLVGNSLTHSANTASPKLNY